MSCPSLCNANPSRVCRYIRETENHLSLNVLYFDVCLHCTWLCAVSFLKRLCELCFACRLQPSAAVRVETASVPDPTCAPVPLGRSRPPVGPSQVCSTNTLTLYTPSLCTHPHSLHTLTLYTPSLCTHPHSVHTLTLYTPSLCTHPHSVHTITLYTGCCFSV